MYNFIGNCEWNQWTDDTPCSKTCGYGLKSGVKTQTRKKKRIEQYGGSCDNQFSQAVPCTTSVNCPSKFISQLIQNDLSY